MAIITELESDHEEVPCNASTPLTREKAVGFIAFAQVIYFNSHSPPSEVGALKLLINNGAPEIPEIPDIPDIPEIPPLPLRLKIARRIRHSLATKRYKGKTILGWIHALIVFGVFILTLIALGALIFYTIDYAINEKPKNKDHFK